MATRARILSELKRMIPQLEAEYHVSRLGVFGSVARDSDRPDSDVDILVEFSETPDFIEFLELEETISATLGRKVDLVTFNALKPLLRDTILAEVVYV